MNDMSEQLDYQGTKILILKEVCKSVCNRVSLLGIWKYACHHRAVIWGIHYMAVPPPTSVPLPL